MVKMRSTRKLTALKERILSFYLCYIAENISRLEICYLVSTKSHPLSSLSKYNILYKLALVSETRAGDSYNL